MLHALLFAIVNSIIYMVIWRIPINLTKQNSTIRYFFAFTLGIAIFGIFMFILPWCYYKFTEQILFPNKVLINTGPWSFYTIGLFIAAFCMLPMAIWLDPETRANIMKEERSFTLLFITTLIFVFLPVFLTSDFDFRITESGFQSRYLFWTKEYPLEKEFISEINLGSHYNMNSNGRNFPSRSLEISIIQKSGHKEVIFTRDYFNPDFSKSLLAIKCKAQSKNIPFKIPFLLIYFTDIQAELYKDIEKDCPH